MLSYIRQCLWLACAAGVAAGPYNTFDGPGFPACHDVASVHNVTSVDEMVSIVKDAAASGTPVRASGKGHMWYDTMVRIKSGRLVSLSRFCDEYTTKHIAVSSYESNNRLTIAIVH